MTPYGDNYPYGFDLSCAAETTSFGITITPHAYIYLGSDDWFWKIDPILIEILIQHQKSLMTIYYFGIDIQAIIIYPHNKPQYSLAYDKRLSGRDSW
jgi:hypothetical protein